MQCTWYPTGAERKPCLPTLNPTPCHPLSPSPGLSFRSLELNQDGRQRHRKALLLPPRGLQSPGRSPASTRFTPPPSPWPPSSPWPRAQPADTRPGTLPTADTSSLEALTLKTRSDINYIPLCSQASTPANPRKDLERTAIPVEEFIQCPHKTGPFGRGNVSPECGLEFLFLSHAFSYRQVPHTIRRSFVGVVWIISLFTVSALPLGG